MANEISLAMIQQLRDRTGAGMMDCKKALEEAQGDMERAIELLRKKGAAVASKRSGNTTAEGIVHAYIHPGSRIGVLIEINCETDFVARTEDFKKFATDLCMQIAAMKPLYVSPEEVDAQFLEKERRFFREQLVAEGKPEKMIDQIVEGKLQKVYAEVCLMKQTFVKNEKMTIDDVLKELIGKVGENIKVRRFARFEIGS
jgi:elongation factor Ts